MKEEGNTNKNVIDNSDVKAGGNIHIGDVYHDSVTITDRDNHPNRQKAVIRTLIITALGTGIGFWGELMPDKLKADIQAWVSAHMDITFLTFWLLVTGLFVFLLLWLTWKDTIVKKENKTISYFESEVREWLKRRYQNRLDQKLAGRLPINLRRIEFLEKSTHISQKAFKVISPEAVEYELTKLFHEAEERLLVVGAPGAGKTTILLQLALGLIETKPNALPVIINLATWSNEFKTLDAWLIKILPVELGVSRLFAKRLLAKSHVPPHQVFFSFTAKPKLNAAAVSSTCCPRIARCSVKTTGKGLYLLQYNMEPLLPRPVRLGNGVGPSFGIFGAMWMEGLWH